MSNTTIDTRLILYLAQLANLELTASQEQFLVSKLTAVSEVMDEVQKLDTFQVSGVFKTTDETNVLRADTILPSLSQEEALQNASQKHQGYFVVDRLIEK